MVLLLIGSSNLTQITKYIVVVIRPPLWYFYSCKNISSDGHITATIDILFLFFQNFYNRYYKYFLFLSKKIVCSGVITTATVDVLFRLFLFLKMLLVAITDRHVDVSLFYNVFSGGHWTTTVRLFFKENYLLFSGGRLTVIVDLFLKKINKYVGILNSFNFFSYNGFSGGYGTATTDFFSILHFFIFISKMTGN